MGTYIREVEDETNGDLLDVYYFCSVGCYQDSFDTSRIGDKATEGGAWPCAESEPGEEVDVYCAECGVLMASPDKPIPVVVNLIERPPFHLH
jgi:hypothetical protein